MCSSAHPGSVGPWSPKARRPLEFLDLLDADDRRELEARAGRRRFKPGATLTHEGAPGSEVLILLSGRAKVSIDTEDGREVVLTFCGPGT